VNVSPSRPRARNRVEKDFSLSPNITSACFFFFPPVDLLESEKICHFLTKKHTLDLRLGTAAVVIPRHMFDHWQSITADRFCRFVFKTSKGEGLFAVIQKMAFRRDGDQCIDYVRVSG